MWLLYIYGILGWPAQKDYSLCGVACRVLLRVLSRCDNSRSVRSFLFRLGLPDRVIGCCSSSVGGDLFSARPYRSSRLTLLGSLTSTSVVARLCLSSTCGWLVSTVGVPVLLVASLPLGISDVSICDVSVLRLSCPSCLCSSVVVAVHSMSGVPCVSWACVFIFLSDGSFTSVLDSSEQVSCVGVVACFDMADCVFFWGCGQLYPPTLNWTQQ